MSGSSFKIIDAVGKGYAFAMREKAYLAKVGMMPFGASLITEMALRMKGNPADPIEQFLWSMPASLFFAWFMFVEVRLLIFGERLDRLPADTVYLRHRQNALRASVIIWLLFNMAMAGFLTFMQWAMVNNAKAQNAWINVASMVLVGGVIWGVRFSVAHILAAVGYSIRRYIFKVNGIGISLRLFGLGLLCVLPVILLFSALLGLLLPDGQALTPDMTTLIVALGVPVSFVTAALLTASSAFALKEMLGEEEMDAA